MQNTQSAMTEL